MGGISTDFGKFQFLAYWGDSTHPLSPGACVGHSHRACFGLEIGALANGAENLTSFLNFAIVFFLFFGLREIFRGRTRTETGCGSAPKFSRNDVGTVKKQKFAMANTANTLAVFAMGRKYAYSD